jgi:hypothetical protein
MDIKIWMTNTAYIARLEIGLKSSIHHGESERGYMVAIDQKESDTPNKRLVVVSLSIY